MIQRHLGCGPAMFPHALNWTSGVWLDNRWLNESCWIWDNTKRNHAKCAVLEFVIGPESILRCGIL